MLPIKTKDDFYRITADWTYDMYLSHTVWLRRALLGLVALAILLMLSLLSNLYLMPLKEKVPYLYAFDHASGEVTHIGQLEPTQLYATWSISRYFLIQYVINYESYNFENIDLPYQLVWAQSDEDVRKQYEDQMKSTNPNSSYKLYGREKYVTVRVMSINQLNDNTVDVKFEKTIHDQHSSATQVLQKEAIIKWTYVNAETTQKMLDRDPLGFKVTYYQVSQINTEGNTHE